ncbi:MAG: hypothetical protein QNJ90_10355 [Planctomycetota bacterium]|nr:hypothetical protein [Planctomycetota bacterium]
MLRRAIAVGLLPLVVAGAVDLFFGVEVTILARTRTPDERAEWRDVGWDPRDGVAELYGIVEPPPGLRAVVLDRERLVHPVEDDSLVLLPVNRLAGEDVLLARALWFRASVAAAALVLIVSLVSWIRRRVRARGATASDSA